MKGIVLLLIGVAAGFVAAHVISRTPEGRAFFDDVSEKLDSFGGAVVEGFRATEAELRSADR